jgi:hypothetical protein
VVRPEHRAVVEAEMARLAADLTARWPADPARLAYAGMPDRQGLGGVGSSGSGDAA